MFLKKLLSLFVMLFFIGLYSFANDILILNNNFVYSGKVLKISDSEIEFKISTTKYLIPANNIYSVEFENVNNKVYTRYLKKHEKSNNSSNCYNGRYDADKYHGKFLSHIALGFLFGPFAVIGTVVSNPTPYNGTKTLTYSKNEELFSDPEYLSCYKKRAKAKLIEAEIVGTAILIVLLHMI